MSAELLFADINFDQDEDGQREEVGRGSYGTVYKGTFKQQAVAVKVIPSKGIDSAGLAAFWGEVSLQSSCLLASTL